MTTINIFIPVTSYKKIKDKQFIKMENCLPVVLSNLKTKYISKVHDAELIRYRLTDDNYRDVINLGLMISFDIPQTVAPEDLKKNINVRTALHYLTNAINKYWKDNLKIDGHTLWWFIDVCIFGANLDHVEQQFEARDVEIIRPDERELL